MQWTVGTYGKMGRYRLGSACACRAQFLLRSGVARCWSDVWIPDCRMIVRLTNSLIRPQASPDQAAHQHTWSGPLISRMRESLPGALSMRLVRTPGGQARHPPDQRLVRNMIVA